MAFTSVRRPATIAAAALLLPLILPSAGLRADHGPATTGASTTRSAGTLPAGRFSLGLYQDFTYFESVNRADILAMTSRVQDDHAHVDAVRWSTLFTADLSYGLTDRLQIGLSTGWYRADDVREGHRHSDGGLGFHELGDVSGMSDLWVTAKHRVLETRFGDLAAIGGVKIPIGRDDVRGDGETAPLEPSLQPGSGAFDFLLGGAYSVWVSERMMLDASAQYTFRTENDGFRIGDRLDAGTGLSYRLTELISDFPRVSVFAEVVLRHLQQNEEDGHRVANSGGTILFVSPGVRFAVSDRAAFTISPQIPVYHDLRSEQQETRLKVLAGVTFTF